MNNLLTSKEAAKYLGYSEGSLRTSRVKGKGLSGLDTPKFIKIGSSIRYKKEDLDAWVSGACNAMGD